MESTHSPQGVSTRKDPDILAGMSLLVLVLDLDLVVAGRFGMWCDMSTKKDTSRLTAGGSDETGTLETKKMHKGKKIIDISRMIQLGISFHSLGCRTSW
jgi:hypothetical protein